MQAKGYPLQDFDLVVQTFAEAVGFAVLPAVLDVATPVADSAGGRVDLSYVGIPVPFRFSGWRSDDCGNCGCDRIFFPGQTCRNAYGGCRLKNLTESFLNSGA